MYISLGLIGEGEISFISTKFPWSRAIHQHKMNESNNMEISSLLVPHININLFLIYLFPFMPYPAFIYLSFSKHLPSDDIFVGIMKTYWRWKNENGRMENNLQIKYILHFHQIVRFAIDYCWLITGNNCRYRFNVKPLDAYLYTYLFGPFLIIEIYRHFPKEIPQYKVHDARLTRNTHNSIDLYDLLLHW